MKENKQSDKENNTEYINEVVSLLKSAKNKGYARMTTSEMFALTVTVNKALDEYEQQLKTHGE